MTNHEPNLTKDGQRLPQVGASRTYWTTGRAPRITTRNDWRFVAEQLALGETPDEIASVTGIKPRRIRAHIRRSPRFRRLIALCAARDDSAAAAKILSLRKLVATYLERHLHRGDEKTARFLAKALGVFDYDFLSQAPATAERRSVKRALSDRVDAQVQVLLSKPVSLPKGEITQKQIVMTKTS